MTHLNSTSRISDTAGTAWAYLQSWAARGISLLVFFILVRILSPTEFGTFAITMVFLTVGEIFVEQLFGTAIVQRKQLTPAHLASAFWATMLLGICLALCAFFTAPYFAAAFDSPSAAPLIQSLAPVPIFMALASVPAALLHRSLDYKTLTRRTALSNLLSGIVSIGSALGGLGVWTFVLQQLVYQVVSTTVLWRSSSWRPTWSINFTALSEIFHFSLRVTVSKLFDLVETRIVELVVGKFLGINALGNFSLAARAQVAATQIIAAPLWLSSVSIFSRKQSNRTLLLASLRERTSLAAIVVMPFFLFTAATGKALVPAVFGHQWLEATTPFQFLCLLGAIRSITSLYGSLLQATGAGGAIVINSFTRTTATICVLPFLLQYGPTGVAGALFLGQIIALPVIFHNIYKTTKLRFIEVISPIIIPVSSALLAASIGSFVTSYLLTYYTYGTSAFLGLLFCALTFGFVISLGAPEELRSFTKKLPTRIAAIFENILNKNEDFKHLIRARIYLKLINALERTTKNIPRKTNIVVILSRSDSNASRDDGQAALSGIIELIKQKGATALRVLCAPNSLIPKANDIDLQSVPIWGKLHRARDLVEELLAAEAIIIIDNDDSTGRASIFEILARFGIARFAERNGIPTTLCNLSIGADTLSKSNSPYKNIPTTMKIVCRDSLSLTRIAQEFGINAEVAPEPAYFLQPSANSPLRQHLDKWLCENSHGLVIGWNSMIPILSGFSNDQCHLIKKSYAKAIEKLIREFKVSVIFIPYEFDDKFLDFSFHKEILNYVAEDVRNLVCLAETPYSAADVKDIYRNIDYAVTSKISLAVSALGSCVPLLAIGSKEIFANELNIFNLDKSSLINVEDAIARDQLAEIIISQISRTMEIKKHLKLYLPSVLKLASEGVFTSTRSSI